MSEPRKEPLACTRFYGEPCDSENCCGGRDSRGRITQRLSKLAVTSTLDHELSDDEILAMWKRGELVVRSGGSPLPDEFEERLGPSIPSIPVEPRCTCELPEQMQPCPLCTTAERR